MDEKEAHRHPPDYQELAVLHGLLGDPHRLAILDLLRVRGRVKVQEIAREIQLSHPGTSHKLALLKQYRLVGSDKESTSVYYYLTCEGLLPLLDQLHGWWGQWTLGYEVPLHPRAGEWARYSKGVRLQTATIDLDALEQVRRKGSEPEAEEE